MAGAHASRRNHDAARWAYTMQSERRMALNPKIQVTVTVEELETATAENARRLFRWT